MLNCLLEVDRLCRYKPSYSKALELDGQANDDVDKIPSALRELRRASQPMPRITTTPTKKKRRVIVIGDSLLKGTKGPICHPDLAKGSLLSPWGTGKRCCSESHSPGTSL